MSLPIPTIIESPFAGDIGHNRDYLHRALLDSLARGEAPFASHGFYPFFLNDDAAADRDLGIRCGYAWLRLAFRQVFYTDLGWSSGMIDALRFTFAGEDVEIYCRALDGVVQPPSFEQVEEFMDHSQYLDFTEWCVEESEGAVA